MRQLLILLIVCIPVLSMGQNPIFLSTKPTGVGMTDDAGRNVSLKSGINVEGTPFYTEKYCMANLQIREGKYYSGVKIKLNLQDNAVFYVDTDGKELESISPIEKIEFVGCTEPSKNATFVSGLPAIDKQDASSFYMQLASGNVSLLKYILVGYRDMTKFGKPDITRVYEQKDIYYSYTPGKGMTKLRRDNKDVLQALKNKKTELTEFIAANNINCQKEEDMMKVFAYYNSLK
ncbi:MAG: hypothetical protein V4539_14895 [Bacteroidota bacterium]